MFQDVNVVPLAHVFGPPVLQAGYACSLVVRLPVYTWLTHKGHACLWTGNKYAKINIVIQNTQTVMLPHRRWYTQTIKTVR